ncbi:hypothetical protein [Halanaerobium sp. MA284_MarDTE_T2]|uniref:hypothetical protein n=1 Tax=Halanaerobium sp. MA284_MarDTE_T2 TaxID=2183913 RepID=UPI000DF2DAD3|nr:hypothetical protein [Halanaerobium sp. MA284_MarDTE_T2]RCW48231.1 hypothetical protein DFR78_1094 [Halanaerobium sp. MA284_MarDTE_T2]
MKCSIVLLIMVMLFIGSFAVTVQAESDWEMTGGLAITNTTLDVWNESIDNLNKVLNKGVNTEEMDNIEKVPMLFLGGRKNINEKWTTEIRYEYIFGTVEGEAIMQSPSSRKLQKHGGEIDVKLHGIVGMADYKLNENWTIGGGIGVYNGSKTKDFEGDILVNNLLAVDPVNDHNPTPNHEKYDLDGISYRFGVGYEKEITANWGFNG